MGWPDIDSVPSYRVSEVIEFMNIDVDHENALQERDANGNVTGHRTAGGAVREIGRRG